MHPTTLRNKLYGVVAFPVTPFKDDLSLDLPGLHHNLSKLIEHPICALVTAGGTGEMYSLTPPEYTRVVELTALAVEDRVPVIAGVGFNQRLGIEMAQAAEKAGADGILVFPPYYPQADDEGLFEYYRSIAAATKLGVLIYSRDWAIFTPSMVERLTAIPNLIAWKDGHGDIRRLQAIMNHVGDRLHWIGGAGDDMVPGYYSIGVRTYTSSIANVAPRLSIRLHELASAGHAPELTRLMNDLVVPLYALRAKRKGYEVSAMKAMMDLLGLAGGPVRPPVVDLSADDLQTVRDAMSRWQPWM
jgi:5-dehydro-4-deoxyglucarate dehydratase